MRAESTRITHTNKQTNKHANKQLNKQVNKQTTNLGSINYVFVVYQKHNIMSLAQTYPVNNMRCNIIKSSGMLLC